MQRRAASSLWDRETKPWPHRVAKEVMLSLRGAVSDEAISVFGQRLLRSARNDTLTLCHVVGVLSHSPQLLTGYGGTSCLPMTILF
jgi:hypothetical protein